MKRICFALLAGLAMLASPASAVEPINTGFLGNTAVKGYDVVAYFTDGKPVEGTSKFAHEWQGATWHFASAEHRDRFKAKPAKYAPQYGGYCAYAVSRGTTANIDPEAWKIVDGKLYLNLDRDVQKTWEKDITGYIRKADDNWPKLLGP